MAEARGSERRPWYRQLHWLILLGMVTGLSLGLAFTAIGEAKAFAEVMSWPGTLFINLLKMIVIPLVFTSIVLGVASLGEDLSRLGRIGAKTFGYYMGTTALAVVVGLVLVNVIRPGDRGQEPKVGVETLVQRHDLVVVPPFEARLGLVQGSLDVPELSVAVKQGPTLFEGTGFGVQTLPVPLAPGRYSLVLSAKGKHLLDVEDIALEPGAVSRLVVTGRADEGTLQAKVLVDPVADPAWVTVRVVHGAKSLPGFAVEPEGGEPVALTQEDGALQLRVLPGRSIDVRLGSGSRAAVASIAAADVSPGQAYTLYVFGRRPTAEPIPLADVVLGIVPANLLGAFVNGDVLPIIFFGLFFGIALSLIGAKGRPVIAFVDGMFGAVMKMTDVIMWTAPIGVAALLGKVVAEMGPDALVSLMWYMATVLLGLAFHGAVVLPALLVVLARHNPLVFARQVSDALVTSFSTASSSATLPVTMEAIEKNAGVSNRIASFVLPLGATINMDGTALYEAVAAMFIAQIYGIDITFGQQVVIFLTATLAAIGAAGVPSAGLVTMLLVLRAVGLPDEGVALIVGVDRLLDMVRTSVNVWGDCIGAYIVARSEGEIEAPPAA